MARRTAFTLLEIILVVVLVGIVAALAVPAMNAAFATYEVRQAASRVRARIIEARSRAIEHGIPYGFVYLSGGTRHGFAACQSLLDAMANGTVATRLSEQYRRNPYDIHLFDLAEGFRLLPTEPAMSSDTATSSTTAADPLLVLLTPERQLARRYGSPLLAEVLRHTGLSSDTTNGIILYPDGATSGGTVVVVSPAGLAVVVEIDELTGQVTVSDVRRVQFQDQNPSDRRTGPRLPEQDRRVQ